ncbi:hypothetical protein KC343_g922 [Hortaea werneckii]|nr:hypothetical protein KC352_g8779 [Hortaea werneckii]KAI7569422.1 hypothetical protein KC317_g3351 [Hortaea werneckii]KAI7622725.1 hypothetical protein KC346_g3073 [Hortaea werneckii]KAI7637046.1 hypothetical protein KC343_g922 [Hortaea werneckii]KAI7678716.1 hypothetical protein KC319_g3173 [Hortaea werneckii]
MNPRRVCDACSVRRIRCNGHTPCAGCTNASLNCTRLRQRHKSGPKGIQGKTRDKLARLQQRQNDPSQSSPGDRNERRHVHDPDLLRRPPEQYPPTTTTTTTTTTPDSLIGDELPRAAATPSPPPPTTYPYRVSLEHLTLYLDLYHHRLRPVWPIASRDALLARLNTSGDDISYAVASSICVATILQLQLAATDANGTALHPESMIDEIESLRRANDYREHPSEDAICVSFFLHVSYLHVKKQATSTLLLREAISMAHMLDLHKPSHYNNLAETQANHHLRLVWLLYITEQAHALQYNLPYSLILDPNLPTPSQTTGNYMLSAFVSLCDMFKALSDASADEGGAITAPSIVHSKLLELPTPSQPYSQLQKADVGVTQHWLRLRLWRLVLFRVNMSTDSNGDITSLLFPLRLVSELLSEVSTITVDCLEAHGSGMEFKLFDFVNALADVMVCMPQCREHETIWTGPQEHLMYLAKVLGGFRGGNEALLPLMQARFTELGLALPTLPRLVSVPSEQRDSSPGRITYLEDDFMDQFDDQDGLLDSWPETLSHQLPTQDVHDATSSVPTCY